MKKFKAFLLVVIIGINLSSFSYAIEPSSNVTYQGIDVSEWQGKIDYLKVKSDKVQIVYIKSSEGSHYVDSQFQNNYTNSKAHGLKIGFYHYVTATTVDQAIQQAKFFVSVIGGKTSDCKLAMDFENFHNLNKDQVNKISLAFLQTVKKASGKDVIVYSDLYNSRSVFDSRISSFPLWIAHYNVSNPGDAKTWSHWVGFQYSDTGKVLGINGNVDLDKYTKEIFLSSKTPVVKIPTPPSPCPGECISYVKIKKGDTLASLAKKYNTTVSCITSLNNIKNPDIIYTGQTLKIYTIQKPCHKISSYTVKKGDTLFKISLNNNTTVKNLITLNNIKNPNLIYIGQIIRLK